MRVIFIAQKLFKLINKGTNNYYEVKLARINNVGKSISCLYNSKRLGTIKNYTYTTLKEIGEVV